MKKEISIGFLFFVIFLAQILSAQVKIQIAYPREGARIPPVQKSFVFGSVSPATASVWINGSTVSAHKTGSFLAMIPFQPGEFQIKAEARIQDFSTQTIRTIFVSPLPRTLPTDPLIISTEGVHPAQNLVLTEGDRVELRFQGSSNCRAEYRVKRLKGKRKNQWFPMQERGTASGIYEAEFVIFSQDEAENAEFEFRLTHPSGKSIKVRAPGHLKVMDKHEFSVFEVNTEETILRAGPSLGYDQMGYELFLPKGVILRTNGKNGGEVRVYLSENLSLWTDEKNLKEFAEKHLPRVILESIKIQGKDRSAHFQLNLKRKVPYRISPADDLKSVELTIFYTISNLDRVSYASTQTVPIRSVQWEQIESETVKFNLALSKKLWGYDVRYEGNHLAVELIFAPEQKKGKSPVSGLLAVVDPGHSLTVGDGAISPQGITEAEVNYKIALCLKEKLEKAGAKVMLTRREKEIVGLSERTKRAAKAKADLFISVHANALPDGSNPWERSGFSIFYFRPQSLELARKVHESYKKMVDLPDDGLYLGNFAVCRITQMPSILTESAYLIRPDEEELLLSKPFQCRVSDAILKGINEFLKFYE